MSQKKAVLIFLADENKAASLASYFKDDDFEPLLPTNSDEFYGFANSHCVELVIIDQQLPGMMTGAEILERLSKELLNPTTVLIAPANSANKEQLQSLTNTKVVLSTTSIEEIVVLARTAMKTGNAAPTPINRAARKLVQNSDVVRPLPQILVKYATQLDTDLSSIDELIQDISVDPKMTSVLLKMMANPVLGARQKITRVADAVNFLGVRKTIASILGESLSQSQSAMCKSLPDPIRSGSGIKSAMSSSPAWRRLLRDSAATVAPIPLTSWDCSRKQASRSSPTPTGRGIST